MASGLLPVLLLAAPLPFQETPGLPPSPRPQGGQVIPRQRPELLDRDVILVDVHRVPKVGQRVHQELTAVELLVQEL
ncbi:MAG: hypothetical protein ACE5H3_12320, partial [Planctomycetota bacterium]